MGIKRLSCNIHILYIIFEWWYFMQKVFIDWGYGMGDGFFSCYKIGEKLFRELEFLGIPAELRVESERRISIEKRIKEIKSSQANILISIDSNWSNNTNHKGIETYYNYMNKNGDLLAKKVQRELIKATNFYNRGIIGCSNKTNEIINSLLECNSTSIVSLVGFYSNPYERLLMEEDKFRDLISGSILKGLVKYFSFDFQK